MKGFSIFDETIRTNWYSIKQNDKILIYISKTVYVLYVNVFLTLIMSNFFT